jgi:carbon monoxide dehydrogenase subunit G
MKVTHTVTYDAPPDEVYAMLTDPAFREKASQATGVLSVEVTVEPEGDGHVVTLDQVQPTEGVPSFAKKFAGETTHVIAVESWSSPTKAALKVDTPGRPTDLQGAYRLEEFGGKTEQKFDGEIKVKVPILGGKLEKVMADLFVDAREKEHAVGAAWLRGERS